MTSNQRKIVVNTLAAIGYAALVIAVGLIVYGVFWTITNDREFVELFEQLLDFEEAGFIFYPAIAISLIALWLRLFLQAGSENNAQSKQNA
jgi:amino acid transporter